MTMTGPELALLITAVLQAGTLVMAGAPARGGETQERDMARSGHELQRLQAVVSIGFFAAAGIALWWRVVDAFVVLFAVLFVLAQVIHAALSASGEAGGMSALALKASVVALAGLAAVMSLDLLAAEGDSGQVSP